MKRVVTFTILLLALSVIALAHGNAKHVMGKVTNVSDNSITVETTDKETVTVEVNDRTKLKRVVHRLH